MKLDERKRKILTMVIEEYIATSKPVGSELVAHLFKDKISSATIRNEMAVLYELGLLEQPHTSSGRVPSLNGYRLYADDIMVYKGLDAVQKSEIAYALGMEYGVSNILKRASAILAEATNCVAIFSSVHSETDKIEKVLVIPTKSNFCIVVMSTIHGVIKHKTCNLGGILSELFLEGLNTFLNNGFSNRSPLEITHSFIQSLISTSSINANESMLNSMLVPILFCIYDICSELCNVDLFIKGSTNLLCYEELAPNIKDILAFLEEHSRVKKLMTAQPDKIQIQIGQNIAGSEFKPFSVLDTCFEIKGKGKGGIVVIGPVKMNYSLCVAYLQYFVDILPKLLI